MNEIYQYLRDDNNHPYGVMYAFCDDRYYYIGISICNRKFDKFNKTKGLRIAKQRAKTVHLNKFLMNAIQDEKYHLVRKYIPSHAIDQFLKFWKRCMVYYKDKEPAKHI